jgi:hypothetical protein
MNTCDITISGYDEYMKLATYHGRDFGDGGKQEPNETLVNGKRISG